MKHLSLSALAVSLSLISCAQNMSHTQVPAVVINAFQQQFPKASDVEWERKGPVYEVEFETGLSGKDHTVLIDSLGKITSHKQDITEQELPAAVLQAIKQQFNGYRLDDMESIDTNGTMTYKTELKKKPEEWKVLFSADGKILQKIAD